ncbi:hypothetical protein P3X46_004093 [Hevea brasiliensis]|uniref:Uncharacterized protein n=1 Tax=Hevea brasiliensis TaxID=3981 RepID=A0ABQ9MW45_HEVBR|nr:ras-related protein RABC2b [Hevea brasiliensis]KAJ9184361.1 hypothetical protein P3X46_004093 [Hevea brasiliensis]
MGSSSGQSRKYDHSFKIIMVGDSGVGKSTLLLSFISDAFTELDPTIGVDMKIKYIKVGGKELKLTIWDTAGQERNRTITDPFYRGADGIIFVYDVTQKRSFTSITSFWTKEVEQRSPKKDCVKILVGNKVDKCQESQKEVSTEEGMALAKQHGFLFFESSAKTQENVKKCFQELALKMLEQLQKQRQEELEKKRKEEEEKKQRETPKNKPPEQEEPKPKPESKSTTESQPSSYTGVPGGGSGGGKGGCC